MNENKTSKYFKYAIGEIILVVIGILIALQINNWNTERINNIEGEVILKNLKKDLLLEMEAIEEHLKGQEVWLHSSAKIITHFDTNNKFIMNQDLIRSINDLFVRFGYTPNLATYSSSENTGKLSLIKNETLREKITVYYLTLVGFTNNTQNNNEKLVDELVNQNLLSLTYFKANDFSDTLKNYLPSLNNESPNVKNDNYFLHTLQKKLNKPENALLLLNVVNFRRLLAIIQVDQIQDVKEKTKNLIKEIEAELKTYD